MQAFRRLLGSLIYCALLAGHLAAAPPDPLRLVPDQAELVVKVERPRHLVEAVTTLDLLKQLQSFEPVRDLFETTNYRQFQQLLGYFEKQLGAPWPVLFDRLGSGGAVLAVKYGTQPPPALLIIQGDDEAAMKKFIQLALEVAEQELARREVKDRLEKGSYRDLETVRLGKEFHAARAGSALVISNNEKTLRQSLDLHLDGNKNSILQAKGLTAARQQLPADPLAWAWLDMEKVRQLPGAKEVFFPEAQDPNVTILFGGLFNVLKRTPHVAAGLYRDQEGFTLTARAPGQRDDMGPGAPLFVPPAGQAGSRPLLEPKGVLLSSSYYFDISKFWELRDKLFTKEQVKGLEDFDNQSAKFLSGNRFSKLLMQAGAYQRVVVVNQANPGSYQTRPKQPLPAFAVVLELREAEPFARSLETIVRGAGLLAGTQVKLKLLEEKEGDIDILGYRFDEKSPLQGDPQDLRFNFSPCIARVGNQYVFCSTAELCHELIGLLQAEAKELEAKSSPLASRTKIYSAGGAQLLRAFEDPLIAQIVLDQGVSIAEARKQVNPFIEWVRTLGVLQIEEDYGAKEFRFDVRLRLGK
jgi:hypothetical protein